MNKRINEDFRKYYDIIEEIGNGAYGNVYKGKEKKTNEYRAIKIMKYDKIRENLLYIYSPDEIKNHLQICINGFIKEYENMNICSKNNKYSVKCYEYFNNKDNFVIIMELCDQNLSQLLSKRILKNNKGFNID